MVILPVLLVHGQTAVPQQSSNVPAPLVSPQRALINEYCVSCHNQKLKTAGLMLDTLDLARVGDNAAVWEKVVRKLRAGMMPPAGSRRPDPAAYEALRAWLE